MAMARAAWLGVLEEEKTQGQGQEVVVVVVAEKEKTMVKSVHGKFLLPPVLPLPPQPLRCGLVASGGGSSSNALAR